MLSKSHHGLLIGLVGLMIVVALAVGAAVWRGIRLDIFIGSPVATGDTPVTLKVGGEPLTIPANRLRFADQRRPGDYPRVELQLKWPGLQAPEPDDPVLKTTARDGELVFITIEPRETDLDTADRIGTIYQKFLVPNENPEEIVADAGGLVRRHFIAGTAYDGEELYFQPGAVHPFAARCFPPDKDQPLMSCLRDVRLGKHLLATIRFPVAALADWRALRDKTDSIFQEMTGRSDG